MSENSEMVTSELGMGGAIHQMRNGHKVARKGWNGKGMFLFHDFEINYGCKVVPECVCLESNEQLKHWSEQDQTERNTYAKYVKDELNGNWENAGKIWAKLKNRSSDDVFGDDARLKEFMNTKFNFDEFDKEDWHRYWVLSQHADKYIEFQKHALEIIKKYLGSDHINYKYLCDRISCKETGTQKYNTQDWHI